MTHPMTSQSILIPTILAAATIETVAAATAANRNGSL